ncbi:MAG TPA: TIGR03435 family protein, partial [Luteitalea sp.]|nr:TIGR03435 family protein [Luteitalea sp.]
APRHATADQTVDMLRALLAERFGLVVAAETRVQRVYAMQLTSSAPSRSPARPCNPKMPMDDVVIDGVADDTPPCGFVIARGRIDARGVDATALADTLGSFLGAQVVTDPSPNRFDLRLRWTDGHALEDVLRSQAGIVLEREARAVPVLAVRAVVAPPQ